MDKKLILIIILIGSLQVYSITFLGNSVKLFQLGASGLMLVIIAFDAVYLKTTKVKQNFVFPIILIFLGLILSMFSAYYFYDQSFALSMYAQREIYYYLLYFVLHILNIEKKSLQRIIIYFGLLYFIVYVIQFFAFPTNIVDVLMREDRNTIRIYLQGNGYGLLGFFLCLQIFYSTNKFKYLILALILMTPTILFGSRSAILTVLLATIFQLLFSKRVKSKFVIIFLVLASLVPAYFFSQNIIEGMMSASEKDMSKGSDYVRIRAAQFYTTQFMPNHISLVTGVGAPTDKSPLGKMTTQISEKYHYNLTDIGIISNFVMYGIFFVIGIFLLVYKTIFTKTKQDMSYIKYFMFFLVFLMLPIAAGFADSAPIAVLCLMFYLIDVSAYEFNVESQKNTELNNLTHY